MKASFYTKNRQKIYQQINVPIILTAYDALQKSADMAAAFEQESNFWWLTGIESAGWWVIITDKKHYLVAPEIDEIHQIFDGSLSLDEAKRTSGVDEIMGFEKAQELLTELARVHSKVYTLGKDPHESHYDFVVNPAQAHLKKTLGKIFETVEDCRLELVKLRAIKQPEEIIAIKKAIALTVEAFETVKETLPSLDYEYQVEALFSYHFRNHGAKGHAYEPIVAAGKNACTLHYIANNDLLKKSDLLLLDIGAKVDGYAADITRTYQIGETSDRQKAVHTAVESAHREIISLLKPGLSVETYHQNVDTIMKKKIGELGLSADEYRKYFPHAISHGLGVDVHDALGRPTEFMEGMILTVEPGIYIPEEGIGVRIEDDILITADGHENLSRALSTSL